MDSRRARIYSVLLVVRKRKTWVGSDVPDRQPSEQGGRHVDYIVSDGACRA